MIRIRLTKLARVRIFDRNKGICAICGLKIHAERGERWDIDHAKPLHMGGANDESNLVPAHKFCHQRKSAGENSERAKSDRVRARHIGVKKPRTIRAWRRFDGSPVYAPRER